ncbi:thiamine pyrophosphate-dependent enzyme [Polyangium sp. y55x31]|uniref:thiamine pyrophosphate-dependent enzyme n=1 Tax=Polyangium sp. y55x31 TaxID=3042688 RepID=UPI0024823BFB|nr:thiamine pyrophosphate-dependent enzyme [Polyangium sp. y55x31]MDI1480280.1 thiamine pyrophosphate-binding protein [Polyangium sp. y55x31]
MAKTAAQILIDRLLEWGVDTVFGLPGDGINGLMEALRVRQERIRFLQVRHEEAAAFMACAHAKFTGKLGVCLATSGPGAIHLLNGLYDAKLDRASVLAITGQTYHDLMGTQYQQEVDLLSLFKDVAVYNQMVTGAGQVRALVDTGCRTALAERGVAHINFPVDLQEEKCDEDPRSSRKVPGHTSSIWTPPIRVPTQELLGKAADLLNHGKKTVILAGRGALGAGEELEVLADRLGAPIVKALLGKAVVPDESPFTTGGLGLLGTRPSEMAMSECDSLLLVGTNFPYLEYLPDPGQARAVQIDMDPSRIGLRYPVEVGLAGDAKATLRALLPLLRPREDRSFLEFAQFRMREWWELIRDREGRTDVPMKPQVVAGKLNEYLADDAILTTDSGTITTWAARNIRIRRGQMFSCSGLLATMAPGLPYAIAAQAAYPKRQVVAFVGDGGFSMLMAEFVTAVKHKLPIRVIVIKNNTLGQIKWEQMVFLGNPEYGCELQPIDFVKFAEACGGLGVRCERPEEVDRALAAAFRAEGPALVEAIVDPFEPPMPPSIKPKQAVHVAESLARGQPNRMRIALTLFRSKIRHLF